ncbi:uncharacterized protein LOC129608627 [Condylostylus longicornis]|uniref:uncharacterized protein LOC129608627 n=1 Tax=Condylostylus longicornis TaxID=2530218 RepID=UPI00244DCC75|nr:uncharacterized protein LOC129608627 [Condylostylus longicornis]
MDRNNDNININVPRSSKKITAIKPVIKLETNPDILKNLKEVFSSQKIKEQIKNAVNKLQADDALPSTKRMNIIYPDVRKDKPKLLPNLVKETLRTSILHKNNSKSDNKTFTKTSKSAVETCITKLEDFPNKNQPEKLNFSRKKIDEHKLQNSKILNKKYSDKVPSKNFTSNADKVDLNSGNKNNYVLNLDSVSAGQNVDYSINFNFESPKDINKSPYLGNEILLNNLFQSTSEQLLKAPRKEKIKTDDFKRCLEYGTETEQESKQLGINPDYKNKFDQIKCRNKIINLNFKDYNSKKNKNNKKYSTNEETNTSNLNLEKSNYGSQKMQNPFNYTPDIYALKSSKGMHYGIPEIKIQKASINIQGEEVDNYRAHILNKKHLKNDTKKSEYTKKENSIEEKTTIAHNFIKTQLEKNSIFKSPENPPKQKLDDLSFQEIFLISEIEEQRNPNDSFIKSEENFDVNLQDITNDNDQNIVCLPYIDASPERCSSSSYSPKLIQDLDSNKIFQKKSIGYSPKSVQNIDTNSIWKQNFTNSEKIHNTNDLDSPIKYHLDTSDTVMTFNQETSVDAVDFLCNLQNDFIKNEDDDVSDTSSTIDEVEILKPEDFLQNISQSFTQIKEKSGTIPEFPSTGSCEKHFEEETVSPRLAPIVIENKILAESEKVNLDLCLGNVVQIDEIVNNCSSVTTIFDGNHNDNHLETLTQESHSEEQSDVNNDIEMKNSESNCIVTELSEFKELEYADILEHPSDEEYLNKRNLIRVEHEKVLENSEIPSKITEKNNCEHNNNATQSNRNPITGKTNNISDNIALMHDISLSKEIKENSCNITGSADDKINAIQSNCNPITGKTNNISDNIALMHDISLSKEIKENSSDITACANDKINATQSSCNSITGKTNNISDNIALMQDEVPYFEEEIITTTQTATNSNNLNCDAKEKSMKPKAIPISSRRPRLRGSKINLVERKKTPAVKNENSNLSKRPENIENPAISPHHTKKIKLTNEANNFNKSKVEKLHEGSDNDPTDNTEHDTKISSDKNKNDIGQNIYNNQHHENSSTFSKDACIAETNSSICEAEIFSSETVNSNPTKSESFVTTSEQKSCDAEMFKGDDSNESNISTSVFNGFDLSLVKQEDYLISQLYNSAIDQIANKLIESEPSKYSIMESTACSAVKREIGNAESITSAIFSELPSKFSENLNHKINTGSDSEQNICFKNFLQNSRNMAIEQETNNETITFGSTIKPELINPPERKRKISKILQNSKRKFEKALTSDTDSPDENDCVPLKKRPIRIGNMFSNSSASETEQSKKENRIRILDKRNYFSSRKDSENSTTSDHQHSISDFSNIQNEFENNNTLKTGERNALLKGNDKKCEETSQISESLENKKAKNVSETSGLCEIHSNTNKIEETSTKTEVTINTSIKEKKINNFETFELNALENINTSHSNLMHNGIPKKFIEEKLKHLDNTGIDSLKKKKNRKMNVSNDNVQIKQHDQYKELSISGTFKKKKNEKLDDCNANDSILIQQDVQNKTLQVNDTIKKKKNKKVDKSNANSQVIQDEIKKELNLNNTLGNKKIDKKTTGESNTEKKKRSRKKEQTEVNISEPFSHLQKVGAFEKFYNQLIPVTPARRKAQVAENSSLLRKLHPNLLLIDKRCDIDNFKIKNIAEDTKLENEVICGLCNETVLKKASAWSDHLQSHYGVGWIVGEESIDVTQYNTVLNFMINFMRVTNIKSFKCRMCQTEFKSALGVLSHIVSCGLEKEERFSKTHLACEICKKHIHYVTFNSHVKNCLLKQNEPTKDEAKISENTEVLSNTGRFKRKSTVKAENKLKAIENDIKFDASNYIKTVHATRGGIHRSWKRKLDAGMTVKCCAENCEENFSDLISLKAHIKDCNKILRIAFKCSLCKFTDTNAEIVKTHVHKEHEKSLKNLKDLNSDSEIEFSKKDLSQSSEECSSGVDENEVSTEEEKSNISDEECNRKKKPKKSNEHYVKRLQIFPSTSRARSLLPSDRYPFREISNKVRDSSKFFFKHNYTSDVLFPNFLPICISTDNIISKEYQPVNNVSMKFSFSKMQMNKRFGSSKCSELLELESFKWIKNRDEILLYIGGPITALEWVPLPDSVSQKSQYLAISFKSNYNKYTRVINQKSHKTLILIFKLEIFEKSFGEVFASQSDSPNFSFEYGITLDDGPVHDMKFLPSGGYNLDINRLGLLAVASAKNDAVIYSLPIEVPQNLYCTLNDNIKLIFLEPVIKLTMNFNFDEYDEILQKKNHYFVQCCKIAWSKAKGHNILATGYANGCVALFDINPEDNLNCSQSETENQMLQFSPISFLRVSEKHITCLDFHYDFKEARWLSAGSYSRILKILDIENPSNPTVVFEDISKSFLTSFTWPIVWENIVFASSSDLCIAGPIAMSPMQLLFTRKRFAYIPSGITCLDYNPWNNICVIGAENGDFTMEFRTEYNLDCTLKRYVHAKIVTYTDLIRLDGNNHLTTGELSKNNKKGNKIKNDDPKLPTSNEENVEPLKFFDKDYKIKYGLVFGPLNFSKKQDKIYNTEERNPLINLDYYVRINSVACNSNFHGSNFYTFGYENGFIRILYKKLPNL